MAQDDIQGQVVDGAGNPVEDAIVELTRSYQSNPADEQVVLRTTTDSNGEYRFFYHPDGDDTTQEWHVSAYNHDGTAYVNSFNNPGVTAELRSNAIPDSVVTQQLTAWYRFEDGDARDYASNDEYPDQSWDDSTAYDGTVTATYEDAGGITDFETGANSGAFDFDGVDDNISNTGLTKFDGSNANDFTLVGWIYPKSLGTNRTTIMGVSEQWHLSIDVDNGDSLRLSIFGDNNAGRTTAIETNQWTHFAVYWDPGTEIITYLNGQLEDTYSSTTTSSGSSDLIFADPSVDTATAIHFEGILDDHRIYSGELSETDISNIYDSTEP